MPEIDIEPLVAFLSERFDEIEVAACGVDGRRWLVCGDGAFVFDPAAVVVGVSANRKILAAYLAAKGKAAREPESEYARGLADGIARGLETAVRILAEKYAIHPDYDPAWTFPPQAEP
jgi:hypothetical protein